MRIHLSNNITLEFGFQWLKFVADLSDTSTRFSNSVSWLIFNRHKWSQDNLICGTSGFETGIRNSWTFCFYFIFFFRETFLKNFTTWIGTRERSIQVCCGRHGWEELQSPNCQPTMRPDFPPLLSMCSSMRDGSSLIKHEFNACLFMWESERGERKEREARWERTSMKVDNNNCS